MTKVIVATRDTSRWPEFAGSTWVRLQYMLGLQKLGLEAYWVDQLSPVDPLKHPHSEDYLSRRFHRVAEEFGFRDRYCIIYNGGERYYGMPEGKFQELIQGSELVLAISGCIYENSPFLDVPKRAYIDVDPGYTQIWAHTVDMGIERHNAFFTVGQNVGRDEFQIPTRSVDWVPILPPVVLDQWPVYTDERCQRFSTIGDWRGSQEAIYEGAYYGTKRDEFVKLLRLPIETGQTLELALCMGPNDYEDLALLVHHNWRVNDAAWCAGDPNSYREYIKYSRAEFSVAKNGYVKSASGWISDRTACYLATGKPVVVQSTGFESSLPVGEGLLTFENLDDAVAAIRCVDKDYLRHCQAARRIAEERFDSDKVLGAILSNVGLSSF